MATTLSRTAPSRRRDQADWHRIFETPRGRARLRRRRDRRPAAGRARPARSTATAPARTRSAASPTRTCSTGTGCSRSSPSTASSSTTATASCARRTTSPSARADKPVMRNYGQQRPGGPLGNAFRMPANVANTSVQYHAGNLLALYEGGRPWQLDPDTLETLGEYDYDGALKASYTYSAHPTWDPATRELYNFGIQYGPRTKLRTYRVDTRGKLHHLHAINLPFATINHDCALTSKYMVFVIDPVVLRVPRFLLGFASLDKSLRFDRSKATQVDPRPAGRRQAAHRGVRAVLPLPHQQRLRRRRRRRARPGPLPGLRQHPPRLPRRPGTPASTTSTTSLGRMRVGSIRRGHDRGPLVRTAASSRSTTGASRAGPTATPTWRARPIAGRTRRAVRRDHQDRPRARRHDGARARRRTGRGRADLRAAHRGQRRGRRLAAVARLLGGRAPVAAGGARRARRRVRPGRGRASAPPRAARIPRDVHEPGRGSAAAAA